MPKRGQRCPGSFSAELLSPHLEAWIEREHNGDFASAGRYLGVDESRVRRVLEGADRENITFDLADRLICQTVGPNLWHQDKKLSAVYGEMCREADEGYPLFVTPEVIERRKQAQSDRAKERRARQKAAAGVIGEFLYRLGGAPVECAA